GFDQAKLERLAREYVHEQNIGGYGGSYPNVDKHALQEALVNAYKSNRSIAGAPDRSTVRRAVSDALNGVAGGEFNHGTAAIIPDFIDKAGRALGDSLTIA
ncbi:MAG: hypothetical protein IT567_05420, partial [Alphaproteobacteria bacterium]|nr:hypothetical protein [Alphaproteobacteria bacterium]